MTIDAATSRNLPGSRPGEYVRLRVHDDGAGMRPEVMARALEPFFTTKVDRKGTGLGLNSVAEFARNAGGFLTLDSEVGAGTTVTLYLPRSAETEVSDRARLASGAVELGDGELVLLVDDNEPLLEAESGILEGLGYAVLTACDGNEAITLIEQGQPIDLVVSDIVMPGGVSGYDVARRALAMRPGIGVVLASGFHDEAVPADDIALRNITVLRKPFNRAELASALATARASKA